MTAPCDDLIRFADGELEAAEADAFSDHLLTCADCRAGLIEAVRLDARLDGIAPHRPDPRPPRPNRPWHGRAIAAAVLAAAVVVWWLRPTQPPPTTSNPIAQVQTRPFEVRFAYADATAYRPAVEQMLGADRAAGSKIPYDALHAFEQHGDDHGLAIAEAINGTNLGEVAARLRKVASTPAVQSDRLAIEIAARGDNLTSGSDPIDALLEQLEALERGTDAAARAARWNHAIVLAHLGLPLSAATAFQAIAAEGEQGWSAEASTRAGEQRQRADRTPWDAANGAGSRLERGGAPVSTEVVRRFPGILRAYFYNAVCSASTRERLQALAPIAEELDRNERPVLGDLVRRVASGDLGRRKHLAEAFGQVLQGKPIAAELTAELTSARPSTEVADIVMCAMFQLDAIADHLEAFRALVKQAGDPWFEIILARVEAQLDRQRGDARAAVARLRGVEKLCSPAIGYRCWSAALDLSELYQDLHRVPEAIAVAQEALRTARAAGEWGQTQTLLMRLADAERFNSSIALARAYATEVLLMSAAPDDASDKAHGVLTGIAIRDLDGRVARRELELERHGEPFTIDMANSLADIGRLDKQPGDLAQLQAALSRLRSGETLTTGERVLADEIEGRLLIESDAAAGIAVLERAIAASRALASDVVADRARTGAYSVLAFEAARRGDHARVLALIARELELPPPGPCTVGMAAEDERAVVIVRGSNGQDRGEYQQARGPHDAVLGVSDELARGLASCDHVQVMATPLLQGTPRALPAELPWSYVTSRRGRTSSPSDAPSSPQALIVANVTPPDFLKLPPLAPRIGASMPRTTTLSGPAATPAAVLAEMATAGEIRFHTHALLGGGVSDASYLVLSPGADGAYALTAEAIRRTALRGHPIVVLAACHSAQSARYQHAAWSLPDAFLAVGARAVFAAAATIPDQEAAVFFGRVLARTHTGTDPAAALRDERVAALTANPASWAADAVLFE